MKDYLGEANIDYVIEMELFGWKLWAKSEVRDELEAGVRVSNWDLLCFTNTFLFNLQQDQIRGVFKTMSCAAAFPFSVWCFLWCIFGFCVILDFFFHPVGLIMLFNFIVLVFAFWPVMTDSGETEGPGEVRSRGLQ